MRRLAAILLLPVLAFVPACGDDDDDVSASGGFCDQARELDEQMASFEEQLGSDELPSSEVFEQTADAIGALAKDAPDEIDDDLETLADGVHEIAEIFGDLDLNDPEALSDPANADKLQEMSDRMEELDSTVGAASDRVERYLADECDIDMSDDGTSGDDDGTEGS